MADTTEDLTGLLLAWRQGEEDALGNLLPKVYARLKRIASGYLRRQSPGHTLSSTALVHEAYLKLLDLNRVGWQDRAHFYAVCSRLMRRILVDHARHHARAKRGGGLVKVALDEARDMPIERAVEVLALDQAMHQLAEAKPEMARVVELSFFGGLNRDEIAEVMGLSSATVTRRWRTARAWLHRELKVEGEEKDVG